MGRRVTVAVFAVAASRALARSAWANSYIVTGIDDSSDPAPCQQIQPGQFKCETLRFAVEEANAAPGADSISLSALGPFQVTLGQLRTTDDLTIVGATSTFTTVTAGERSRVFSIAAGATVQLAGMTIADGFTSGAGGNIAVEPGGTLTLARVTRGRADQGGGGILNEGTLTVHLSLIDNNSAGLDGGGLSFDSQQTFNSAGSIVAANGGQNCTGAQATRAAASVESGTECGFAAADNRQGTDAGIATGLSDQGGQTLVLTIPAGSPAVDLENPCTYPIDQRSELRTTTGTGACDAGAYEQSPAGNGGQPPIVTPTPTPTPVTAQPTPTPVPTPVANQTVVVREVSGTVKIKLRGTNRFVDLDATRGIPLGSEVDAKKGRIELISVPKPGAPPEKATFYDGICKVRNQAGSPC
jgi:hypothetical protein